MALHQFGQGKFMLALRFIFVSALAGAMFWAVMAAGAGDAAADKHLVKTAPRLGPVVQANKVEIVSQSGHTLQVNSVAFSPDGRLALSGSTDKTLKLWDVTTGKQLRTFGAFTAAILSVTFSPDSRFALSGGWDNTVKLWDLATGKEVRNFSGHVDLVRSVAFSPDGRFALSGGCNEKYRGASCRLGVMKYWDVATGSELRSFTGHADAINSIAFSPDGRLALTSASDFEPILWDLASGKELRVFIGHAGYVDSVAFSPDGRFLLSGSWDKTLKLWDVTSGRELRTFRGHEGFVSGVFPRWPFRAVRQRR